MAELPKDQVIFRGGEFGPISRDPPSVAVSGNGKTVATAFDVSEIRLFNTSTSKELPSLKDGKEDILKAFDAVNALDFSPDGKHLAVLSEVGEIQIWDWAKAVEVRRFAGPSSAVPGRVINAVGLAYAPDGKSIATLELVEMPKEKVVWALRLWDPAAGSLVRVVTVGEDVSDDSFTYSPDSKTIAVSMSDGTICFVDVATGKIQRKLERKGFDSLSLTFGKDGTKLYAREVFSLFVEEWDVGSGKLGSGDPKAGFIVSSRKSCGPTSVIIR